MQICPGCETRVSESLATCPGCGEDLPGRPRRIGPYRTLDVIYEGEHTTTYRAEHVETGEAAAVVRFLDRLSEERARRLAADVDRLAAIRSKRIIPVEAFGVDPDGTAYRVKPLVEGEAIPLLVPRGYFHSMTTAYWCMVEVTRAVDEVHAAGMLIPYLVPNDVLVADADGPDRSLHVSYHGYRFLDPKKDRPGPSLRHLLAHHPDLGEEAHVSRTSDIYTLGMLFHEMLTGERIEGVPKLDPALRVPPALETLLLRMLDPDPSRRPQTTEEVLDALEAARAAPRPKTEIATRETRTSFLVPVLFLAGAVVLVTLAVLFASRRGPADMAAVEATRKAVFFIRTRYRIRADAIDYDHRVLNQWLEMKGTGFLVDDRTVVTARHVLVPWHEVYHAQLDDEERDLVKGVRAQISVWQPDSIVFKFDVAGHRLWNFEEAYRSWGDEPTVELAGMVDGPRALGTDLAALRLKTPLRLRPVELASDRRFTDLRTSEALHLWSYPAAENPFVDKNRVTPMLVSGRISSVDTGAERIAIDMSNYKGSSGGPILSPHGRVVGIALEALRDQHDFTIALGSPALRRFIATLHAGTATPVWFPPTRE